MAFELCVALAQRAITRRRRSWNFFAVAAAVGEAKVATGHIDAPSDAATRGADRIMAFDLCLALAQRGIDRRRPLVNGFALAASMIVGGLAISGDGGPTTTIASAAGIRPLTIPPAPPPLILRDVSPQDALAINQQIPFSADQNTPAKPFQFRGDSEARSRALQCLTLAIYYEAANQSREGQEAVAQVVLNRVRHPAFPPSVCGVVFQGDERKTGCQFTFTCDGSLLRQPNSELWSRAQQVAQAALDGAVFKPVGLATHYHADYVVPYWATSLEKNAQIGVHIFYRWPNAWGRAAAFSRKYAGNEADPAVLRAAAIMQESAFALGTVSPDHGLQFTVDPRIELLSVVQMLATGTSDLAPADQQYERDVESYFAPQADHEAVQLFRKLSKANDGFAASAAELLLSRSPPPELAGKNAASADAGVSAATDKNLLEFVDALKDFARSSEFDRFFAGHKPFYASVVRRTEQQVGMARAYWQAYTGVPLHSRKVVLSSLMNDGILAACQACDGSRATILSLGKIANADGADVLLRTEGARGALAAAGVARSASGDPGLDEQIVRAVFARVDVLRRDRGSDDHPVGSQASDGSVSSLDRRLVEYETHRSEFATFGEFVSRVLSRESDGDSTAASNNAVRRVPSTAAQIDAVISQAEQRPSAVSSPSPGSL